MKIYNIDTCPLPVDLITRLHNSLPKNSPLREEVINFLKDYKKKIDPKGHVVEGFRLDNTGHLVFDELLYEEAIYRGKIETYTSSAKEQVRKLRSELEMVKSMGDNHAVIAGKVDQIAIQERVGQGEPISEEEEYILSRLTSLLLNPEKKQKQLKHGKKQR